MSSSDSVKNDRLTFRADIRIESEKRAAFEAWLNARVRQGSKTSVATEALETLKILDEAGGVFLPKDILKMVVDYCDSFDVPPKEIDVIRKAINEFTKKSRNAN